MSLLRHRRVLLLLTALFFGVGHGHQVLGQFEAHHLHGLDTHSIGEVHNHEGGEHDEDEGDTGKDADHMLAHHATLAVVSASVISVVVTLHSVALVDWSILTMPDAPVAGIDHPPPLGG